MNITIDNEQDITLRRASEKSFKELGLVHSTRVTEGSSNPLIYLVHGRAGNVDVMSTFKRTIPDDFQIISVQAPYADPIGGFSWWQVKEKLCREEVKSTLHVLCEFIESAEEYYDLKTTRRIALGFSQGAGLLSATIESSPKLFFGLGFLAGFLLKNKPLQYWQQLKNKPAIFKAHGIKDPTISIEKAREEEQFLREAGFNIEYVEDDVAHKIGTAAMRSLKNWLAAT